MADKITFVHNITHHIIGRESEVDQIWHKFEKNKVIILNGVGGIGKSTVAVKYVEKYKHLYDYVAWIYVHDNLVDAFLGNTDLLDYLNISEKINKKLTLKDTQGAFKSLLIELAKLKNTLVIIDNALYGLPDIYSFLHNEDEFKVLITSRINISDWPCITVGSLPPQQSVEVFNQYYKIEKVADKKIINFLKKFQFLTLMIELIAKSAQQVGMRFNQLSLLYADENVKKVIYEGAKIAWTQHSSMMKSPIKANLSDYLKVTFNGLVYLSNDEKRILSFFSIAPDSKYFTRKNLQDFFEKINLQYNDKDLFNLHEKGWLIRETIKSTVFFKIHPIIGGFIFEELKLTIEFAQPLIDHGNKIIENKDKKYNDVIRIQWKEFLDRVEPLFHNPDLSGT